MEDFLRFFGEELIDRYYRRFDLNIDFSHVIEWNIEIYDRNGECPFAPIVIVNDCDMRLAFAKAQVEFKEWLCENEGGY